MLVKVRIKIFETLRLLAVLLAAGALSLLAQDVRAQKTDKVVLYRGDTITGTIKGLSRGRLDYSTDDMNRVSIEWEKVARIKSTDTFEIELTNATDYIGTIEFGENEGEMVIVTKTQRVFLRNYNVVRITPIGASFLTKIDGKIDVGLDITRANNQKIWNTHGRFTFRSHKWKSSLDLSSYINSQDSIATSTRTTGTYDAQRFIDGSSWSVVGAATVEQNDELNLEHRYTFVLSAGNFFVRTNQMIFQGFIGAATTNEAFVGEETSSQNIEALLGSSYELFKFANPEVDFTTSAQIYVSLTNLGRMRPEFNLSLTYEVFSDFDVGLRGYVQADTEPGEGARNVDYAITTTVGYSWD